MTVLPSGGSVLVGHATGLDEKISVAGEAPPFLRAWFQTVGSGSWKFLPGPSLHFRIAVPAPEATGLDKGLLSACR